MLAMLVFGIIKFSILFNNYETLTDAVRVGARTLAVQPIDRNRDSRRLPIGANECPASRI